MGAVERGGGPGSDGGVGGGSARSRWPGGVTGFHAGSGVVAPGRPRGDVWTLSGAASAGSRQADLRQHVGNSPDLPPVEGPRPPGESG